MKIENKREKNPPHSIPTKILGSDIAIHCDNKSDERLRGKNIKTKKNPHSDKNSNEEEINTKILNIVRSTKWNKSSND